MGEPTEEQYMFLRYLAQGIDFQQAALKMGLDKGTRVSFACILNGWVDRGQLTEAGRAIAEKPLKTTKFEVTVLKGD